MLTLSTHRSKPSSSFSNVGIPYWPCMPVGPPNRSAAPSAAMPTGGARWAMRLRRRAPSRPAAKCHMGIRVVSS
eukprot:1156375-Pelagomonas_calceolata.AAC.2